MLDSTLGVIDRRPIPLPRQFDMPARVETEADSGVSSASAYYNQPVSQDDQKFCPSLYGITKPINCPQDSPWCAL